MDFIGRNSAHPELAFAGLQDGAALHGLTDGSWSFSDALTAIFELTGPADIRSAHRLLTEERVRSLRFLVDRSFQTRQPTYCRILRQRFGDDAIRVWNAHTKFAVVSGDQSAALYLTSANLNQNRRVENFSLFVGGDLPAEYLALVEDVFTRQGAGDGFTNPRQARPDTVAVLGPVEEGAPKLKRAKPLRWSPGA